jgi:hypothetical protein
MKKVGQKIGFSEFLTSQRLDRSAAVPVFQKEQYNRAVTVAATPSEILYKNLTSFYAVPRSSLATLVAKQRPFYRRHQWEFSSPRSASTRCPGIGSNSSIPWAAAIVCSCSTGSVQL